MTRFNTFDARNAQMPAPCHAAEAPCCCEYSVHNYAAVMIMGTSTLVSILLIMAALLHLYGLAIAAIIALCISIIYLRIPTTAPKETSDLW